MKTNPLFENKFIVCALAIFCAGCASLPDASTSTYPAAECRITPATGASLAGGKRQPADRLDQIKAINDFARFEASTRNVSPAMQVRFEEILRECGQ